jgi:hypothetical protein
LEHVPGNGDLGHLENNAAAVADDPRSDLDQVLFQAISESRRALRKSLLHPGNAGSNRLAASVPLKVVKPVIFSLERERLS